jgi:simple sugar transport system ATP-binding protein
VVISQDLDELLELCDTLAVINGGRLSRAMTVSGADINEIGLLMGGIHGASGPAPVVATPSGIGVEATNAV